MAENSVLTEFQYILSRVLSSRVSTFFVTEKVENDLEKYFL